MLVAAVFLNRSAAFVGFPVVNIDHMNGYWGSDNSHRVAMIVVLPLAVGLVTWAASARVGHQQAGRRGMRATIAFALWSTVVTFSVAEGLGDNCCFALLALGAAAVAILAPPAARPRD